MKNKKRFNLTAKSDTQGKDSYPRSAEKIEEIKDRGESNKKEEVKVVEVEKKKQVNDGVEIRKTPNGVKACVKSPSGGTLCAAGSNPTEARENLKKAQAGKVVQAIQRKAQKEEKYKAVDSQLNKEKN